jgi:outer membrane autotransporter protein
MNGGGNAVTAEAGYRINFDNGCFLKPTAAFSYNQATYGNITQGGAASAIPFALAIGPVVSELGVVSLQAGMPFRAGDWALIPNAVISGWHEFAGAIPSQAFSTNPGAGAAFNYALSTSRVGTFGQIGVGIAASPLKLPNLVLSLRTDYRTGENITGATFTFGGRYSC